MEEQEEAEAEEEEEEEEEAASDIADSAVIRSILSCIFLAADSTPSCVILLCIPRVRSDTSKLGVVKFIAGNMDGGRRAWEREMK